MGFMVVAVLFLKAAEKRSRVPFQKTDQVGGKCGKQSIISSATGRPRRRGHGTTDLQKVPCE
jgi:hypothetical protein